MAARKGRQRCARIVAPGRQTIGGCWLHRLGTSSPAVFPCFSLFFFLFISSVDHSPPLAPHPDRPPTPHQSSFPLPRFLLRLSNCRSAASIISALVQLARKGREKLLVVVTLPPPPWHHKREGWREEGKGSSYSLLFFLLFILSPVSSSLLLASFFTTTTRLFFSKPVSSSVLLIITRYCFPKTVPLSLSSPLDTLLSLLSMQRDSFPRPLLLSAVFKLARRERAFTRAMKFLFGCVACYRLRISFKTCFRVRNELTKNFCAEAVRIYRFLNLKELFLIVLCVFLLLT